MTTQALAARRIALAGAVLSVALACGGDDPSGPGTAATVSFSQATAAVALKGSLTLEPVFRDDAGRPLTGGVSATWESSDADVASVDGSGVVRGHALGGPVTISVRAGTAEASVQVAVVPADVRINPAVSAIAVGASVTLGISAVDALGGEIPTGPVSWSSDVPSVASVDPGTGAVTGVGEGNAVIRANAGTVSATTAFYVGLPRSYDGEYVTTDTPNLEVSLTVFLGRITRFTADYRPSAECRFEFGATPNLLLTTPGFTFQLSNWASTVSGNRISDDVIVAGVGTIPASALSPGCLVYYGLSNVQNLSTRNVGGPSFTLRRPTA